MTQTTEYQGPPTGLKVIDFGHYYVSPMVGMVLADRGATVIHSLNKKVSRPALSRLVLCA